MRREGSQEVKRGIPGGEDEFLWSGCSPVAGEAWASCEEDEARGTYTLPAPLKGSILALGEQRPLVSTGGTEGQWSVWSRTQTFTLFFITN